MLNLVVFEPYSSLSCFLNSAVKGKKERYYLTETFLD